MDRKGLRSILMVLLGTEKTGDLIAQRMKGLKVDRYRIILTPVSANTKRLRCRNAPRFAADASNRKGHPRGECPALPSEAGLEADPRALVPVTASFVPAPTVFVSGPAPCVGIHLDAPFGLVVVLVLDVPAIAFPVAYDGSRGVRRRE